MSKATRPPARDFKFDNGYGASVISDGYGGDSGLYELAVLDQSGKLTYDTPITDDVLGWLSEAEVQRTLDKIAALTPEIVAQHAAHRAAERRKKRIAELREELAALEAEMEGDA